MRKAKRNRLYGVLGLFSILVLGVYLILSNLEDSIVFFYPPSEIEKISKAKAKIRVGGIVEEGSVKVLALNRMRFNVTDYKKSITIEHTGVLPAMFREKQGIVAEGILVDNVFITTKLLTKHDENYMPPEISKNLNE